MATALWTHGLLRRTFAPTSEATNRGTPTRTDRLSPRNLLAPSECENRPDHSQHLHEREIWTTSEPVLITCLRGSLWITRENDARDHILRAGESWISLSHAHVVAQAIDAAELVAHSI